MRTASTIVRIARAAVVAAALGGAALTAMPAQAASSFSFGFGFGPGPFVHPYPYMRPYPGMYCMTDWQVRNALARAGYSSIRLYAAQGRLIRARAVRGSWVYLIDFNRCSGYIVGVTRLRHR
jgi:hypothetical protein